ncbi:MAG: hypothetical protein GY842_17255 [bacterium]|nr:hypothetical protein [bacterium]
MSGAMQALVKRRFEVPWLDSRGGESRGAISDSGKASLERARLVRFNT